MCIPHLSIKPSGAGSSPVCTVTSSSIPDFGFFRVEFRGDKTPLLPFNQTDALIKAAIEALPSVRNYNGRRLTVTVDNQLAVTGILTITVDQPVQFTAQDKFEVVQSSMSTGGVQLLTDDYSTVLTAPGSDGFTSGSYDVSVYALVYKSLHSYNGKLTTELE